MLKDSTVKLCLGSESHNNVFISHFMAAVLLEILQNKAQLLPCKKCVGMFTFFSAIIMYLNVKTLYDGPIGGLPNG